MEETNLHKTETKSFRGKWIEYVYTLQAHICNALEALDGKAKFREDEWQRAEGKGGGGTTKVIANGNIFEKAGVNVSVVYGHITDNMRKHLQMDGDTWFATTCCEVMLSQLSGDRGSKPIWAANSKK